MLIIKGKHNIAKVMIDEIDSATHEQIQTFVNQPMFARKQIVIMPDCHKGMGSCIGFTMQLGDYIMPQIVGVDLSCGMFAVNFGQYKVNPVKFDLFVKEHIPSGHNINDDPIINAISGVEDVCKITGASYTKVMRAVASIGSGNHFLELDYDEQENLWLVIHTGSRNFGKTIADFYQKEAGKLMKKFFIIPEQDMEFIPIDESIAHDYIESAKVAGIYAHMNRWYIAEKVANYLGAFAIDTIESVHNYIDFEDKIIRKGAIRAHEGERCIIPFNSAEGSAICVGKGNAQWNYSAPHGAGRLMSRTQAFTQLDYKEYQKKLADNNVYSSTANSSTLDEAPMAYKNKESILMAIEPTVEVVSVLKPFYNFKSSGGRYRK